MGWIKSHVYRRNNPTLDLRNYKNHENGTRFTKVGGDLSGAPENEKEDNFPLGVDGKTLEKTGIHLWEISKGRGDLSGAPENEKEE